MQMNALSGLMLACVMASGSAQSAEMDKKHMCEQAVDQARVVLELMRNTVERNRGTGFLKPGEYQQAKESLDRMDPLLTERKCMASSGVDLKIYECLSARRGNLLDCTAEYST